MTRDELEKDLELAVAAARAAGERAMHFFRSGAEVRFKAPDQPVTEADLAANRILADRLLGARSSYGWLSEESADSAERLAHDRVWVVDPIDGTNSFVEGRSEFVVSVGLVQQGRPVVAALFNPATGEMFHALRGGGAFCNDAPIAVADLPAAEIRPLLAASRSELRRGEFAAFADHWEILPLGSTAYRMLKVADGTVHAFFSRSPKQEWDVCAAALVLEEAGGRALQVDGAELRFNQREPRFRGIAATGRVPLDLSRHPPL